MKNSISSDDEYYGLSDSGEDICIYISQPPSGIVHKKEISSKPPCKDIHKPSSTPNYLIQRKKIPKEEQINKKEENRKKKNLHKKVKKREESDNCNDSSFCSQMEILDALNASMYMEEEALYKGEVVPHQMLFDPNHDSAFFFGKTQFGDYVGKRDDIDGHILGFGRSGSGKTTCIIRPTLDTWKNTIFAIDLKGDLISQAKNRRAKILYFMPDYQNQFYIDPFYPIRNDSERNLIRHCRSLAFAIIPLSQEDRDPFWTISARHILTGALVYFYRLNVSFVHAILAIKRINILKLLKKIASDDIAKTCINVNSEKIHKTIDNINAVLQNYLIPFATDVVIQEALSSDSDNPKELIKWEDLENYDIFIRMELSDLDQFSGAIRLMLTQLITTLKRRPEKYTLEGKKLKPTLLLFDEFPQYGKVEEITSALKVLRSKNVTIALFCQSLADLDATYGAITRRCILDNCPYKTILSADDLDTQKYWSELVGTVKTRTDGFSSNFDEFGIPSGYNFNVSSTREPIIYPHEFASLNEVILIHPEKERFCRLEKELNYKTETDEKCEEVVDKQKIFKIKTLEMRIAESKKAVKAAEQKRKQKKREYSEDIDNVDVQMELV